MISNHFSVVNIMNHQQRNSLYSVAEQEKMSSDIYYLNRLTALWGEDCLLVSSSECDTERVMESHKGDHQESFLK